MHILFFIFCNSSLDLQRDKNKNRNNSAGEDFFIVYVFFWGAQSAVSPNGTATDPESPISITILVYRNRQGLVMTMLSHKIARDFSSHHICSDHSLVSNLSSLAITSCDRFLDCACGSVE